METTAPLLLETCTACCSPGSSGPMTDHPLLTNDNDFPPPPPDLNAQIRQLHHQLQLVTLQAPVVHIPENNLDPGSTVCVTWKNRGEDDTERGPEWQGTPPGQTNPAPHMTRREGVRGPLGAIALKPPTQGNRANPQAAAPPRVNHQGGPKYTMGTGVSPHGEEQGVPQTPPPWLHQALPARLNCGKDPHPMRRGRRADHRNNRERRKVSRDRPLQSPLPVQVPDTPHPRTPDQRRRPGGRRRSGRRRLALREQRRKDGLGSRELRGQDRDPAPTTSTPPYNPKRTLPHPQSHQTEASSRHTLHGATDGPRRQPRSSIHSLVSPRHEVPVHQPTSNRRRGQRLDPEPREQHRGRQPRHGRRPSNPHQIHISSGYPTNRTRGGHLPPSRRPPLRPTPTQVLGGHQSGLPPGYHQRSPHRMPDPPRRRREPGRPGSRPLAGDRLPRH